MKKGKWQIQLRPERMPRAAAAAMLASSLCAFVLTGIPGTDMTGSPVIYAMLLCAVFTAAIELASLSNAVLLGSCAAFACAGGALCFIPFGDGSVYTAIAGGSDIPTARVLIMALMVCGALCLAICVVNRFPVMRCAAAGGLLLMLIVFIWLRISLLTLPAILITAYILIVLCQLCASGTSAVSDTPREMWFIMFSLIVAVTVFSLPYPDTRIQWEKFFEINRTAQMEQLGEVLDIDPAEQDEDQTDLYESGYSEEQSSLGGWVELVSDVQLQAKFSDNTHSDRLTGGIYDSYTGSGWICQLDICGTGYTSASVTSSADMTPVSDSDIFGSVHITEISGEADGENENRSLFYPPYSHLVVSCDTGETAARDQMKLTFLQAADAEYDCYYYRQPCECELTDTEREYYLSLPETLPARVRELALTATDGRSDDESKALGLMRIFSAYRYDTHVSTLPDGRDFVDYFLFDSKVGYCAYFASSMTVMARCAGIPARYVQGYYIGSDTSAVTVTSRSAHAWAELYIDGRWIVYDPVVSPVEDILSETETPADTDAGNHDNSALNRILIWSYAAIAAGGVVFIVFRPFFRLISYRLRLRRRYGRISGYPVIVYCTKLLWVLSACGIRRNDCETLTEFGTRIGKECEWLDDITSKKICCLLEQTGAAIYAADGMVYKSEDVAAAVRTAYIRRFGLLKYLRSQRRASV